MAQPTPTGDTARAASPVEYGQRPAHRKWPLFATIRGVVAAAVLLVLAILSFQRFSAPAPTLPAVRPGGPLVDVPAPPPAPPPPRESERARVTRLYQSNLVPLLDRYDDRNRQAAERAIATLRERLEGRRAGIKPFVDDVQSWRTTFGVVRRKTREGWRRLWQKQQPSAPAPGSVQRYVEVKFQRHVLSPLALHSDVEAALTVFREDVEASRNQLYAEVRLPLSGIKVEQVETNAAFAAFTEDVQARARVLGASGGTDAVVSNLTAFAAGWVAGEVGMKVATRVTGMVVTRVGTQLAARAAVSGGATVTGATAGGGTGSLAGPAGTVIGVAVGVAAGAAVDWWMSEKFEAKLTGQLNAFLTDLQQSLVEGSRGQPGLRTSFDDALKANSQMQRQAMIDTLLKETAEQ